MARIFLGECEKTEPVQLADKLIKNGLKVGQATWDFYSDSGTVDVIDIYYREDDALKNVVYDCIEEIYNIKPIIKEEEE